MKVIFKHLKNGELKVKITCIDDLWYLSHVIDKGDLVSGKSYRKIKVGSAEKSVRKPVFVVIEVERVEFHKTSNSLRVMGIVREGSEDVPRGSHHTLEVEEGTILTIVKKSWPKFQLDRIEEACRDETANVLICALDRDEASFALLKKYGFDMLSEIKGRVEKKDAPEKVAGSFYMDVARKLNEYSDRMGANRIIIASPAFWKEDFMKVLKKHFPNVAGKVMLATCNNTGAQGIKEILMRDEVKKVLKEERTAYELQKVNDLLREISKNGLAAYGINEVKKAASAGAIKCLLVEDKFMQKMRQEGRYAELDSVMKLVEMSRGEIVIVSSEHEGGKELAGIGGIGAVLRYRVPA